MYDTQYRSMFVSLAFFWGGHSTPNRATKATSAAAGKRCGTPQHSKQTIHLAEPTSLALLLLQGQQPNNQQKRPDVIHGVMHKMQAMYEVSSGWEGAFVCRGQHILLACLPHACNGVLHQPEAAATRS